MFSKESKECLREWLLATTRDLMEHPESWPRTEETAIRGSAYCAALCTEAAPYMGEGQWKYTLSTYRGKDAAIEMSVRLGHGDAEDIARYMRQEIEKRASESLYYVEYLCRRIEEKDDDYHSDFW